MYVVSLYICVPHAYSTCRGQKRASNPLELITVVSSQVGAESWGPLEKHQCSLAAEPSLRAASFLFKKALQRAL